MQNEQLLEATGSEPLTLQQEYEMQESWRCDENKCTFIVLARQLLSTKIPNDDIDDDENDNDNVSFVINNVQAMAGDVNLFLSQQEDDDEATDDENHLKSNNGKGESQPSRIQAELDIMIAEPSCRKMGIGRQAVGLMMLFGIRHLNITRFFCKINQDNVASLSLFGGEKTTTGTSSSSSLGFVQCGYAECFGQYEYELKRETVTELEAVVTAMLGTTSELQTFSCPMDIETAATTER
jgi:Acetyltransferase (GNAT) domain